MFTLLNTKGAVCLQKIDVKMTLKFEATGREKLNFRSLRYEVNLLSIGCVQSSHNTL